MKFPCEELSDVCEIIMGQAPAGDAYNDKEEGYPLVAGAGDFGPLFPSAKKHTTEASKLSRKGDIILGIRASIGAKVLSDKEYCLGRGVAGLRPSQQLDSRYLWHWLEEVRMELLSKGRGATFLQVNRKDIQELQIPLPPPAEQKRIAGILDVADTMRAKRRESLAQLDSLLQSSFLDLFGDPVSNPMGLPQGTLETAFKFTTGKLDSNAAIEGGKYPFFTCARETFAINDFAFDCEALLLAGNNASADYSVKHYTGKFNAYQRTYVITINEDMLTYKYARVALEYMLGDLKRFSKGSNTKYLTMGILNKMPILIPSLPLQQKFAGIVESVERQKERQRGHLAELDALFASLQHRAFRGEL